MQRFLNRLCSHFWFKICLIFVVPVWLDLLAEGGSPRFFPWWKTLIRPEDIAVLVNAGIVEVIRALW